MIELHFEGIIPAKKNNRDLYRVGNKQINRPNKKYRDWHDEELENLIPQLDGYPRPILVEPLFIGYLFTMPDFIRRDLSNAIQSIEDLLKDYGLITDDAWKYLQCAGMLAVHKEGISRCDVWIEDNLTDATKILRENYEKLLTE